MSIVERRYMNMNVRIVVSAAVALASAAPRMHAQDPLQRALSVTHLEADPNRVVVTRGEWAPLGIVARDAAGNPVSVSIRIAAPRRELRYENGRVRGITPGEYEIIATLVLPASARRSPASVRVPVTVAWPPLTSLEIDADPGTLYRGTTLLHTAKGFHDDGTPRPGVEPQWSSSDPSTATVDQYGYVAATRPGTVTISARFEDVTAEVNYHIEAFPAAELDVIGGADEVRTGDVQEFSVVARDRSGDVVDDLPVTWSLSFKPADGIVAPSGPGQIDSGRMVADVAGVYTVIATAGPLSAHRRFTVVQRDVIQRVQIVGHGRQDTHYTSDFWIFEGVDGRDYALTGGRQSASHAFMWDVTDPGAIFKTDSIRVDARSVNDVKVSPDARYAVMSREGASNRRNGVVIMDLAVPAHPTVASVYDEGLTGGVHNVFATDDNVFAVSNGDKYVILDVRDIYNPTYVSEYDHPDSRVHDVWVHDGIAYSAEWGTGVVVVDVGNGRWGGSIGNPVLVTVYPTPSGRTHTMFPYVSKSTGTPYLFVGDEITNRRGLAWEGNGPDHRQAYDPETGKGGYPRATSGYMQVLDVTDPENAQMIARYEVSEYGSHNMWVEDDILYQAYYEGGMRIVDVSGELMGNLFTQGREIAVFKPNDPLGWIPNAPATWSVRPYKGNIFFADINSGIWAVKLEPRDRPVM